ncbi:MAG: hypothetical protein V1929_11025 [bacterium]
MGINLSLIHAAAMATKTHKIHKEAWFEGGPIEKNIHRSVNQNRIIDQRLLLVPFCASSWPIRLHRYGVG